MRETGCGTARRTQGPSYAYRHTADSTRQDENALQSRLEPRLAALSLGADVAGVRPSLGAGVAATDRGSYCGDPHETKHECTATDP